MKKKVIEVVLLEGIDKDIGGAEEIDLPRARPPRQKEPQNAFSATVACWIH
jgi:hypothetical protein